MTYVISDIHGHYSRYQAMLKQIRFGNEDMLYVLGDMIDRGPDGVKVLLDLMARPNVTPILGNHELTAAVCLPWLMKEITDESIAALEAAELGALSEWRITGWRTLCLRGLIWTAHASRTGIWCSATRLLAASAAGRT